MMNRVFLPGRLGRDPETGYTSSGQKVTTMRLAVSRRRGGQEETLWWRVTVWGDRFDKMMTYLKKGSALIVIGEMDKPQIYTDRDGNPQVSLNVTATDLSFAPFGRPADMQPSGGESRGEGMQRGLEEGSTHRDVSAGEEQNEQSRSSAPTSGSGVDFSESQSFSEDEIPF